MKKLTKIWVVVFAFALVASMTMNVTTVHAEDDVNSTEITNDADGTDEANDIEGVDDVDDTEDADGEEEGIDLYFAAILDGEEIPLDEDGATKMYIDSVPAGTTFDEEDIGFMEQLKAMVEESLEEEGVADECVFKGFFLNAAGTIKLEVGTEISEEFNTIYMIFETKEAEEPVQPEKPVQTENPQKPEKVEKTQETVKASNMNKTTTVKTGDTSNTMVLTVMVLASCAAILTVGAKKRRSA